MYRSYYLLCLMIFFTHLGYSQSAHSTQLPQSPDSIALLYASTITESDLKNYLSILASDALEGRETGTRGQKMAAAFIREHFRDNKLQPIVTVDNDSLFFQQFKLYRNYYDEISMEIDELQFKHKQDFLYIGNAALTNPVETKLQFVGNGEEHDYKGLDVEQAMVAFYANTLDERRAKIKIAKEHGAGAFFVLINETKSEYERFRHKNGSMIRSNSITWEKELPGKNILVLGNTEMLSMLLNVTRDKLNSAVKKSESSSKNPLRKIKPTTVKLTVNKISEQFETENVLGFVEGSDKKDELIVITAHYDHEGRKGDQIYNGADDDGSGTSALMEIAQAFSIAKSKGHGPRRSLLFMAVTGEEKGLLGSEFYSKNPSWPLEKTISNLNIDMIGRVDPSHELNEQYVYIIGSDHISTDLHLINERVNLLYTQMELDYKYNSPDDPNRFYYRSDHYNFAKHNIPIIFYFNGTHADYHQPTDTVEKIRFDLLKKRTDLVYYCAWELANREVRIRIN